MLSPTPRGVAGVAGPIAASTPAAAGRDDGGVPATGLPDPAAEAGDAAAGGGPAACPASAAEQASCEASPHVQTCVPVEPKCVRVDQDYDGRQFGDPDYFLAEGDVLQECHECELGWRRGYLVYQGGKFRYPNVAHCYPGNFVSALTEYRVIEFFDGAKWGSEYLQLYPGDVLVKFGEVQGWAAGRVLTRACAGHMGLPVQGWYSPHFAVPV